MFSLYFCGFLVYANVQKPRILVLHSYDKEYAWTRDVSVGIRRVLDKYPYYSIKWHYMDTKRRTSPRYKLTAASTAKSLINRWEPHVIIAIDDNAQTMRIKNRISNKKIKIQVASAFVNKPGLQVVFSGVNGTREQYGYVDAENVTGILERLELNAIKTMIREILGKDDARIGLVTDKSTTSEIVHKEVQSFKWHPMKLSHVVATPTFNDWKEAIKQANKKVDILLFTNYHTVARSKKNKQKIPPRELIGWTMENTNLPNIGGWGFFVEDGGMIATGVSPYEQGEEAAKMAVEIIEKKITAGEILHKSTQQFITYARRSQMEKAGFKLPKVYEAFARATDNYYEESFEDVFDK